MSLSRSPICTQRDGSTNVEIASGSQPARLSSVRWDPGRIDLFLQRLGSFELLRVQKLTAADPRFALRSDCETAMHQQPQRVLTTIRTTGKHGVYHRFRLSRLKLNSVVSCKMRIGPFRRLRAFVAAKCPARMRLSSTRGLLKTIASLGRGQSGTRPERLADLSPFAKHFAQTRLEPLVRNSHPPIRVPPRRHVVVSSKHIHQLPAGSSQPP